MKRNLLLLVAASGLLAACGPTGPNFTHSVPLSDGSATIKYDCGSLEGDAATNAVRSAHNIYSRKYQPRFDRHNAKLERIAAGSTISPSELLAALEAFSADLDAMEVEVATTGCSYVKRERSGS